jgi:hypothetical protein
MAPARHSLSLRAAVAAPIILALLAGCGSSHHSSSSHTGAANTGAGAVAQITRAWTTFFNGATPTATRVSLLQNGRQFQPVLSSQAGSPLAQQASARVHGVTLTGARTATVRYDVLLAGKTALPNQTGTAVLSSGTWQVADASFCALLRLEGAAPPACPKG